jgi:hypothetical protein
MGASAKARNSLSDIHGPKETMLPPSQAKALRLKTHASINSLQSSLSRNDLSLREREG